MNENKLRENEVIEYVNENKLREEYPFDSLNPDDGGYPFEKKMTTKELKALYRYYGYCGANEDANPELDFAILTELSKNTSISVFASAIAKIELAKCYEEGIGIKKKDLIKAKKLFEEADELFKSAKEKNIKPDQYYRDEYYRTQALIGVSRINMKSGLKADGLEKIEKVFEKAFSVRYMEDASKADRLKKYKLKKNKEMLSVVQNNPHYCCQLADCLMVTNVVADKERAEKLYKDSFETLTKNLPDFGRGFRIARDTISNLNLLIKLHSEGLGTEVNKEEADRLRSIRDDLRISNLQDLQERNIELPQLKSSTDEPNRELFDGMNAEELVALERCRRCGISGNVDPNEDVKDFDALTKISKSENIWYSIYAKIELAKFYERDVGIHLKNLDRAKKLFEEVNSLLTLKLETNNLDSFKYLKSQALLGIARYNIGKETIKESEGDLSLEKRIEKFKEISKEVSLDERIKKTKEALSLYTSPTSCCQLANYLIERSEISNSIDAVKDQREAENLYISSFKYLAMKFSDIENVEAKDITNAFITELDLLIKHHSNGLGTKVNEEEADRLKSIRNELILQTLRPFNEELRILPLQTPQSILREFQKPRSLLRKPIVIKSVTPVTQKPIVSEQEQEVQWLDTQTQVTPPLQTQQVTPPLQTQLWPKKQPTLLSQNPSVADIFRLKEVQKEVREKLQKLSLRSNERPVKQTNEQPLEQANEQTNEQANEQANEQLVAPIKRKPISLLIKVPPMIRQNTSATKTRE
jgi:TPR repeat protein